MSRMGYGARTDNVRREGGERLLRARKIARLQRLPQRVERLGYRAVAGELAGRGLR